MIVAALGTALAVILQQTTQLVFVTQAFVSTCNLNSVFLIVNVKIRNCKHAYHPTNAPASGPAKMEYVRMDSVLAILAGRTVSVRRAKATSLIMILRLLSTLPA
jgi:hypothetical protein